MSKPVFDTFIVSASATWRRGRGTPAQPGIDPAERMRDGT